MSISQALWVMEGGGDGEVASYHVSYLYPIITYEEVNVVQAALGGFMFTFLPGEVDVTQVLIAGVLGQPLLFYTNWPTEKVDVAQVALGGVIVQYYYSDYLNPPENVDVVQQLTAGQLAIVLFFYLNWPTENVNVTSQLCTGGTLV